MSHEVRPADGGGPAADEPASAHRPPELRLPKVDELAEPSLSAAREPYAFDMPILNGRDDIPAERTRRFLRFH